MHTPRSRFRTISSTKNGRLFAHALYRTPQANQARCTQNHRVFLGALPRLLPKGSYLSGHHRASKHNYQSTFHLLYCTKRAVKLKRMQAYARLAPREKNDKSRMINASDSLLASIPGDTVGKLDHAGGSTSDRKRNSIKLAGIRPSTALIASSTAAFLLGRSGPAVARREPPGSVWTRPAF